MNFRGRTTSRHVPTRLTMRRAGPWDATASPGLSQAANLRRLMLAARPVRIGDALNTSRIVIDIII